MTSNEVIKSTRHNLAYKYQFDCGILKMVGPKKARFLAKNQHTQGKSFSKNPSMNYGSSKSAKIVLSKSIFNVKNQLNFLKRNLGLGQIYWPKD